MSGNMHGEDASVRRVRLEVEELAFTRPSGDLFGPMSFSIDAGQIVGVIGPTGSGKSALFDLVAGRHMPRSGSIMLDGRGIDMLDADARSRLGLVLVSDPAPMLSGVTVFDWLALAIQLVDRSPLQMLLRGRRSLDASQAGDIAAILQFCSLQNLAKERLSTLTPAQLKMTEIARGLCQRPRLMLLHRPFSGLPRGQRHDLALVLRDIAAEAVTLMIVDEQLDVLAPLCDRMLVLQRGHLVAAGAVDELAGNEAAVQAFTGSSSRAAA
ncbi:MAG: ATP-binding cassette domain-containing protein [Geminicoccaceae bacterium]